MAKKNNDEMVQLTRNQLKLALIVFVFSILFSSYSLYIADHANTVAEDANTVAEDANNISLMALSHQKIIEESDLQVGTSVSDKNKLNDAFIRVPIINGYYAKYPASIITERIEIYLNDNKPIKLNIEPHYDFLINKDNPTYFEFVFGGSNTNQFIENIITVHLPTEKIMKKNNSLLIKIPYNDFTLNGNEYKMIYLLYHFDFTNGRIENTTRIVSRVPIKITEFEITI